MEMEIITKSYVQRNIWLFFWLMLMIGFLSHGGFVTVAAAMEIRSTSG